jgi:hypothetical protein
MAEERPYIDDILATVREGRIGAAAAADWLELRAAEHAREARQVRAHATQQMRDRLHGALDSALFGGSTDEFSRLFPPWAPLGPDLGHEEYPSQSLIYPGEQQGQRSRQPRMAAGALTKDEDYDRLFPPEYRQRAAWGWD